MKIGVSGASGKLGSGIVTALIERAAGREIVGVSRSPDTLPSSVAGRFGDYDQPESLTAAYAGLDRLVLIPTTDMRPGQRLKQNLTAIDAAVAANVGQICLMSSAGTRKTEEPDVWASYFPAEQRLMRTAKSWSVMRMNFYAEAFAQDVRNGLERGALAGIGNGKVGYVSRDDLALAVAGLLATDGHDGAIYTGTGPASLSGAERAAIAAEVTGRPFQYFELTEAAYGERLAQAGLPPAIVGVALSIQKHFAEGGFDIVTGDIEHLSGRPPRPLSEVLAAAFAPAT